MSADPGLEAQSRETLTRVLAGESRNALARVELAASELARFETSPALRARVDTIRAAVEEIDGLLGKIDVLSDLKPRTDVARIDLVAVAASVFGRLAPVLAARGLRFAPRTLDALREAGAHPVAVPPAVLETMLLGLVRLACTRIDRASPVRIDVSSRDGRSAIVLRGVGRDVPPSPAALEEEAAALELEVELAEWSGVLLAEIAGDAASGSAPVEVGLALPTEPLRV